MTDTDAPPAKTRVHSVIAFFLGLLLLVAAVWAISSRHSQLKAAWEAAQSVRWYLIVAMFLLPFLNWMGTTSIFWVLTGRYGRVRWREMAALIASAWLLNYLPMRPGMVGRLTYHKKVNNVRVRDSIKVLAAASATTGAAVGVLLGTVLLLGPDPPWALLFATVAAPTVLLLLLTLAARRMGGQVWRWPAAGAFRYFDITIWAIRYWIAFAVVGHPVTPVGAAAVTLTGQAAMLAPVQIGLREWVVGATSALIPPEWSPAAPTTAGDPMAAVAPGLMADVAMRATELTISVPLGLACSLWLFSRLRRGPALGANPTPE